MKWFRWLCILGIVGSPSVWAMPDRWKKYHFMRWDVDYKILFEEHNKEIGLAPDGLVYVRHVEGYKTPPSMGRTGKALDPVRSQWVMTGFRSRTPWPVNSRRIMWDEWGPSQWVQPDGIMVTQVGAVFCVPYSAMALGFASPLVLGLIFRFLNRGTGQKTADATDKSTTFEH